MSESFKEKLILLICIAITLVIAFYPFHYGYFCDELYYIILSKHLALGYVDVPPLMPLCLAVIRYFFGESLFAIHILPALFGIIILVVVQKTVKKMEGGLFAQSLALISITLLPVTINRVSVITYDAFNGLFWTLAIYSLVLLLISENKKYWLYFGIAAGFGLLSKFDILWLGAGLTLALPFTAQRKYFASRQFWLAGLIAIVIASPYIYWNFTHDFLTIQYFIGYSQALSHHSTGIYSVWQYLKDQIVGMNPLTFPIWALGLYYFLFNPTGKRFRLLGVTFLFVCLLNIITHAKFYLVLPYYFVLIAGGSVYLEKISRKYIFLRNGYLVLIILAELLFLPYVRPILPPEMAVKYVNFLGQSGLTIKYAASNQLPQWLSDLFGWDDMAASVAKVYHALPPNMKSNTVILTRVYDQASAIDFYRKQFNLPIPISGHDQYYVWGSRDLKLGSNVILVGYDDSTLPQFANSFKEIRKVGKTYNKYAMPYNNKPIYLGIDLKQSVEEFWKNRKAMTM